jgi:hypothetical protein
MSLALFGLFGYVIQICECAELFMALFLKCVNSLSFFGVLLKCVNVLTFLGYVIQICECASFFQSTNKNCGHACISAKSTQTQI